MAKKLMKRLKFVYENHYKKLLIIPMLLLAFAIVQVSIQYATTGEFLNKGISLKGGLTLSIPTEDANSDLKSYLKSEFPKNDIETSTISSAGKQVGLIVEIDIPLEEEDQINKVLSVISEKTGVDSKKINVQGIGSALSDSFFRAMIKAVLFAFLFMGCVVFLYFRTPAPSLAVILAAFSDMFITLSITNVIGMKISTAGIAAFLMMIGYSVDTDILLSVRVLKGKTGTVMNRVYSAIKTGLTMNITTLVAVTIGFLVSESEVIRQIMGILIIGLLVDMINTWIQNVGILRLYLERKGKQ